MNKKEFQDAINIGLSDLVYTPEMEQELYQYINGKKPVKRKISFVSIITIAIMLLILSGIAFAVSQTGILSHLLGENVHDASEDLLNSIQPLDIVAKAGDICVNITGGLYDGEHFLVSWEITNEDHQKNVLVEVESILFNGIATTFDNVPTNDKLIPPPFSTGEETDSVMSGVVRGYVNKDIATDIPEVQIVFAVSEAVGDFIVVDPALYERYDESHDQWIIRQVEQINDAGIKVAASDELNPEEWAKNGYTVINAYGYAHHMNNSFSEDGLFFERPGQWEKKSDIRASFTLDRSLAEKYTTTVGGIEPMEVGDHSVVVNTIVISPLSTAVDLECVHISDAFQSEEEVMEHSADVLPWLSFADEDGFIIEYTNLDWEAGWSTNVLSDGSLSYQMRQVFPGLKKPPSFIVLFEGLSKSYDVTSVSLTEKENGIMVRPITE